MMGGVPVSTSRRRSLAWRVAVGVFLLVAVVVVVQASAVLWVVSRGQQGPDGLSATTRAVGERLGPALQADPNLDVAGFLRDAAPTDRLFVIMRGGATFGSPLGRERIDDVATFREASRLIRNGVQRTADASESASAA